MKYIVIEFRNGEEKMDVKVRRVIKRNGEEVSFDVNKILNAVRKANNEIDPIHKLNEYQIAAVGKVVADQIESAQHAVSVEDIQDMVERGIMECVDMKLLKNT